MTSTESADDRLAVLQLQARYGDLVTRRAWDEVSALFLPECRLRLDLRGREIDRVGADEIVEFVAAGVGRFAFFLFSVVNSVVDVEGDDATARLSIREHRVDHEGVESTAFGLYRDRCRRLDGEWRFAARDYTTLARSGSSGKPLEVFDIPDDDVWWR